MFLPYKKPIITIFLCLIAAISFNSCISYKSSVYFNDINKYADDSAIEISKYSDPIIRPNDVLNISIQTLDPQATSNILGTSTTATYATQGYTGNVLTTGFLVDKDGNIELSLVGKINVGGLTTSNAREVIRLKAAQYYKDPIVNIRFVNFNITVLGEVARPSTYTVANEKVSILDALGLAGDLTIYGKRDDVLLTREENGKIKHIHFNLNSTSIFQSPYFYLRQGDVIYVSPIKARIAAIDATTSRTITLISAGITIITFLLYFIR